jgi:RimJ/RimL family protein N-acetyltransferase
MLATALPDLVLNELGPADVQVFYDLLQQNRSHLTAHGDFMNEVAAPLEKWIGEFAANPAPSRRLGIFLKRQLIGRIDLIAVEPPKYSVGYWLAEQNTGHGFASAALVRLLALARDDLGATDVYAGVTHGNMRSEALLERLGFVRVVRFERYTRFHRAF